ncbi:hypothetical protein FIBSPDRAFT_858015 [Athelia psychrophila]|uniref:C2H2-type domain-containing protein n=1 Tax=Athelia psychrophila TaxID=1759441 RepID=A0A166MCJ4_9AGAM|nr:hypothetical protein FIBSPDRAFT_858015 [Fibularhizoctonia sp. CBS 109695]
MAMAILHQLDGKQSYLNDLDYAGQQASSYSSPPFDQLDYSSLHNQGFPRTPSYNGSYHNSPYSGHSELSFGAENDQFEPSFDDESNLGQLNGGLHDDYDPSEYDPPNQSVLMFGSDFMAVAGNDGSSPHISVSVTPAPIDYSSPQAYDHSSPSSNGGGESGNDGPARSRGSSVSSNPNFNNHMGSPRLDVTQGFENMRFESPNWGTRPLSLDRSVSPQNKPQSPPQLLIPDSSSPNMYGQAALPLINAPDGDGGIMGPSLHLVPATPVGIERPSQSESFQSNLEPLQQGSASGPVNWPQSDVSQMSGGQYPDHAQPFNFPGHSHDDNDIQGLSMGTAQLQQDNASATFLFPINNGRLRRKSDTDLRPPPWGIMSQDNINEQRNGGSLYNDAKGSTVNLSDILPSQPSHPQYSQVYGNNGSNGSMDPPPLIHHSTFGPPMNNNNFLSPESVAAAHLRRSKSDSGSRPGHQRQSRSEDMRHSNAMLYPPSSRTQQEFITRQFLHPSEVQMPIRTGSHHRRASSGSRMEAGTWSGASSSRPSPYPSPHVSPRYNLEELPDVMGGRQAPMIQHNIDDMLDMTNGGSPLLRMDPRVMEQAAIVSKPNVTTGRTANASRIRRKQDANFECPVPGCGSTFTRSFNLKGHMRSHNEEKPFQCKWPGCGKGFARQHDCKRHEQLHSNYRPFTCDGCNKNFARMDALNRHLRSEGGADCQKILHETQDNCQTQDDGSGVQPKQEDLAGWPGMSVMV